MATGGRTRKRITRRRLLATAGAGAAAAAVSRLTGPWTGAGAFAAAPTPVAFWGGWTGPDGDVMRQLVEEYNSAHAGVRVTLTLLQWTPLFTKFVAAAAAGQVPDVLAMHGPDIPQFAAQQVLSPLEDVIRAQGFAAGQFARPAWDGTLYNGRQYAFPLDLHMHAVYYNAALFRDARVTPPATWIAGDEFVKIATALTRDKTGRHPGETGFDTGNVVQHGLAMYNNHHGFFMWYALLRQQGHNLLNRGQTKVEYPFEAGVKAWQWLQDLVFKHRVVPVGETNPLQDFLIGKTAMLIDGPWELPAMAQQKGLTYGSFPRSQVFAQRASWGSGHVLTVPSGSRHKNEAQDLIAWIVRHSGKWGFSGNIPALNSALQSAEFRALPGRRGFVESLPYEVMLPAIPKEAQVFSAAGTSPIVVVSQQILIQNQNVAAALKTMNERIDGILAGS